ncbi:MAG: hypothetical protein K6L74_08535 [Neptuniibacter sp.]
MNIKTGLVLISTLCFSLSAAADSSSAGELSQVKGGPYDMSGYLNLMTVNELVRTKKTSLEIKGGPFDLNGYLNAASEKRPSTMAHNKSVEAAKLNMHAQPNLLFASGS